MADEHCPQVCDLHHVVRLPALVDALVAYGTTLVVHLVGHRPSLTTSIERRSITSVDGSEASSPPFEDYSVIRRATPYFLIALAVVTFVWGRGALAGLWWLALAVVLGLRLPWRIRLDDDGVTLSFLFRRREQYPKADIGVVLDAKLQVALAVKGRGLLHVYRVPGVLVHDSRERLTAAVGTFDYVVVPRKQLKAFTQRRPKPSQREPES